MAIKSLTATELQLLTVVITECGDVPPVNFENVAKQCGIKYARNARAKFKDIMKKLKSSKGPIQLDPSAKPAETAATTAKPTAHKGTRGVARTLKVNKARGRVGTRATAAGKTITRRGRTTTAVNYEESDDEDDDVKMEQDDGGVGCDDDGAEGDDEEFQDAVDYRATTPDRHLPFDDDDEPRARQSSVFNEEGSNSNFETFFRISKAATEANIGLAEVPEAIENAKANGFESVMDYIKDIGPFCPTPGRDSIDEDIQPAYGDGDEDMQYTDEDAV